MTSKVKIFQTYYLDKHRDMLDPNFVPFDVSSNPAPHLREFPLYYKMFRENKHLEHEYTGIVSYKFKLKSRFTGEKFLNFIASNPGYDVYFINPYPQISYFSFNIWQQGEYFHPGLYELTEKMLAASDHNISLENHGRDKNDVLLYANFWTGNELFWNRYIPFLLDMHDVISASINQKSKNPYLKETPYITTSPMYPFIFERLFTTFIKKNPDIKFLGYKHDHDEIRACCNSPAELATFDNIYQLVDKWDTEGTYTDDHRAIFSALLASTAEYENLMAKIGTHPFIVE